METPAELKAKEPIQKFTKHGTIWIDEGECYTSPKKAKEAALICIDREIDLFEKIEAEFVNDSHSLESMNFIKSKLYESYNVKTAILNYKP